MNITITGATGAVGTALAKKLVKEGHVVHALGRRRNSELPSEARFSTWHSEAGPPPTEAVASADAIVNLAGESIAQRWTPTIKERIRGSRVAGTRHLVEAIASLPMRPQVLISASAVGIYGSRGDEVLTEWSKEDHSEFLGQVTAEWEQAAELARPLGIRVVRLRLGTVLGKDGALASMAKAVRRGLIRKFGSGRQWVSWIHIDEVTALVLFALNNVALHGPVNASAPNPVTNAEFMQELSKVLGRPGIFSIPPSILSLMLGEMGNVALASQRAIPQSAQAAGFRFEYPQIRAALDNLLRSS